MQVAFQNDNCSLFSPPKNRARNLCRSQASKTECSESGANCVRGSQQFAIANHQENGRIQQHKKMALLRGSFTDEEERDKDWRGSTLDHTRRRVCSRVLSSKPRGSASGCEEPSAKRQSFFFRKREKAKSIFFFYKKKTLLLLLSYLFFNSKDMTLIPGVYISTLSQ